MDNELIGTGHYIFAGIFIILFLGIMAYAYRKDLKQVKVHYSKVWMIIILILVIYFIIFFTNKWT